MVRRLWNALACGVDADERLVHPYAECMADPNTTLHRVIVSGAVRRLLLSAEAVEGEVAHPTGARGDHDGGDQGRPRALLRIATDGSGATASSSWSVTIRRGVNRFGNTCGWPGRYLRAYDRRPADGRRGELGLRQGRGDSRVVASRNRGLCAIPPIAEPSAGIICGRFSVISIAAVQGWTGGGSASSGWWPSWRARVSRTIWDTPSLLQRRAGCDSSSSAADSCEDGGQRDGK